MGHLSLRRVILSSIAKRKRGNKKRLLTTALLAPGLLTFAVQARSAEIAGFVIDIRNSPVTSAYIRVKDQAGSVVGRAETGPDGHYSIEQIAGGGKYSITLTLPGTKYQGQTIETGMPPEGLCLSWTVSQSVSALATGRPGASTGTCRPLSAAAGP